MEKGPMEKGKYKCEFLREVLYFGQYTGVTWKPKYHLSKIFLLANMKLKQHHGDHQEHCHFGCCSMA